MNDEYKVQMQEEIRPFSLPPYKEIPNVGLFLDQTVKYINEYLTPLDGMALTGSMVSNYVKKKILRNPVKKQYDRDQLASLIFIAVAKSVLSLEDVQLLFGLQEKYCTVENAYEFFRRELHDTLQEVFGIQDFGIEKQPASMSEQELLRNMIIAVAHKVYLDKYLKMVRKEA